MGRKPFIYLFYDLAGAVARRVDRMVKQANDAYKFSFRTSDVKARVKRIDGGYRGNGREFRDVVQRYWSRYGVKPQRIWYDLYCDGMNAYDPRFIPDPIWFKRILPYFNRGELGKAYADKGIYSWLLKDVAKPDTIVKNIEGHYFDGDGDHPITREEAERLCAQEEHLIVKPSLGTKGAGILFYDRDDENSAKIPEIFDAMKKNYVVQRIVKQHPDLARLNPDSLNTVRIISFHFKDEVHFLSALLRIGGVGSRIDNVSAGGSACAIKPDGWLHEKSVTRASTWTDETASGIKLKDIRVPNYEGIKETVKRLHYQLPYFNIIGWDFAVGEDGTPIFIEFNTKPGQNQISCGPTFGDLTDEVLEEVFIKKR